MTLDLFVFSSDPAIAAAVGAVETPLEARADALVIDWERTGKGVRQRDAAALIGIDTQIASDDPADVAAAASAATVPVVCRIDVWSGSGPSDLERAIDQGASEVILPMVESPGDVEHALTRAAGRVGVGAMIETVDAVARAAAIESLPLSRVYVGLMDLALQRRTPDIFAAVHDGTVERLAEVCANVAFGFAGLTIPSGGSPVPTRLLAAEMVRLGCSFTFLRRSFLRDAGHAPGPGLAAIRGMVAELEERDGDAVESDRKALAAYQSEAISR